MARPAPERDRPHDPSPAAHPDPLTALRVLLEDYNAADEALTAENDRAQASANPTDDAAPSCYHRRDDAAVALVQAAHRLLTVLIAVPACTEEGQPCAGMHTVECQARRGMQGLALTNPGQPIDPWAPWADLGEDFAREVITDGLIDLLCAGVRCGADPHDLLARAIEIADEEDQERQASAAHEAAGR